MSKGNLLIVDDEPLILKNLKITLEDYADNIFMATNGIDALEIISKELVHCIICDINMPKMNGVEVIANLREKGNDVPVIFYTGHGNQSLMIEAAKYGAFDFLDKPNLDGLEDVIARGMKKGFVRTKRSDENQAEDLDAFISEYSKLLENQ
jgi:two-component system nitrogen regulation response regulator NtrX